MFAIFVSVRACLNVCEAKESGGCLDIGVRPVWEDQSGSLPPFLHPAGRERKKGTGSFTSHFTTVQGLCVYRWSLPVFLTIQYVITLEMGIRLMREVAVQKSPGQLQTRTSRFSGCSLTINLSIRTSGSCREAKGALQTDSLHFWNIYLRVYRQLNSFHDASVLPELRNVASSPRLMPVCALFQLKKQTLHDNDRK